MGKYRTRPIPDPLPVRAPRTFPVHAGRRIVVTGAAGYLGRATAELLARQGAHVVVSDIDAKAVASTVDALRIDAAAHGDAPDGDAADGTAPHGDAFGNDVPRGEAFGGAFDGVAIDVGDEGSVARGIARAINLMGGVDGLVNCAAIVPHTDPLSVPRTDFERVFAVNVFGAYEAARLVARHMIDTGTRGAIVNVASEAGKKGHVDSLAYSASKAALISMTRMLSEALAPHDINVNAVCPGGLETPMLHEVARAYSAVTGEPPADIFAAMRSDQLGRHLQPVEVARMISFLLSDEAMLVRGQALNVDAGETPG